MCPPGPVARSAAMAESPVMRRAGSASKKACAGHTIAETGMACGRCEAPVCGRCVVGVAYLIVIQLAGAIFNLIPIPPLDGFGALSPHLSHETQAKAYSLGYAPYFLVLLALWMVPGFGQVFWDQAYRIADGLGVPAASQFFGYQLARLR